MTVTCPFCALHCDDLQVAVTGTAVTPGENACCYSQSQFAKAAIPDAASPSIAGQAVTLAQAVARAAELLGQARSAAIVAAGDVATSRLACSLAERCRGVLDHPVSEPLFRQLDTLQSEGWLATSFSEARNRADLVMIIGEQIFQRYPRLLERIIQPEQTLYSSDYSDCSDCSVAKTVILIGSWDTQNIPSALNPATVIRSGAAGLGATVAWLRAILHNRPLPQVAAGLEDSLTTLAEQLKQARYPVILWAVQELDEHTIEHLNGLVRELSEHTRCVALSLGGDQGATTLQQVCTWRCGFPPRTAFYGGYSEFDPYRYDYRRLLTAGELDLLFWIDCFSTDPPPPFSPSIVLGHPGLQPTNSTAVVIPVGIPGIDHPGQIYRADGIALPLHALRRSALPAAATVIQRIMDQLP